MKIVAIGGGEIGRFKTTVNTTIIDREIVRLSGKKTPRLLFVPTASAGCDEYCAAIYRQFSKKLGCKVDILLLVNTDPERKIIKERMAKADIIYVGEGNTLKMMRYWQKYGVDQVIIDAMRRGAVLCGSSAGSIAWFNWGNSDSMKTKKNPKKLIRVTGLGLLDALICPHYDTEKHRRASLKEMMKNTKGVAIALEECCAFVVVDKEYRIVASIKDHKAYRVYWKNGEFIEEEIAPSEKFAPLHSLLTN